MVNVISGSRGFITWSRVGEFVRGWHKLVTENKLVEVRVFCNNHTEGEKWVLVERGE